MSTDVILWKGFVLKTFELPNEIIKIKRVKSKQLVVQISEPVLRFRRWTLAKILLIISDYKAKTEFTYLPIFDCKMDTKQFKVRIFSCFSVFELPDNLQVFQKARIPNMYIDK